MVDRQAYIIMAHADQETLFRLLKLLDDKRNDIFIHINSKSNNLKNVNFKEIIQNAQVFSYSKYAVAWWGDRILKVQMLLLSEVVRISERGGYRYNYIHILSGNDFPLKSQDEIINLLDGDKHNYIEANLLPKWRHRIDYYKLTNNLYFGKKMRKNYAVRIINKILVLIQKILGFHRVPIDREIYGGLCFCSIKYDFAKYVVEHRDYIRKQYYYTEAPEELYLQDLILNSEFKDTLVGHSLHYINWNKKERISGPVWLKDDDYEKLMESDRLFCRKISVAYSPELVKRLEKVCRK